MVTDGHTHTHTHGKTTITLCLCALVKNLYEVHLPWKKSHPLLENYYHLSLNCLISLLQCLRRCSDVLKEYNAVIKDQMAQGIVKIVKIVRDSEVNVTSCHYMPRHAVV